MSGPPTSECTTLLTRRGQGDRLAGEQLFELIYDDLRAIAHQMFRSQPRDHTLQTTALVHEAYCRLIRDRNATWRDRAHFFAIAARAMRHVLVDHARRRQAAMRGGGWQRVALGDALADTTASVEDLVALDDLLEDLAARNDRQARVIELRFFGGLSVEEAAHVLGVCKRTAEADWHFARAWLSRELQNEAGDQPAAS